MNLDACRGWLSEPRGDVSAVKGAGTLEPQPGARITIATAPNLRDLGGWPTRGAGRIRNGGVYRSAELNHLHDADLTAFAALGIRTVYDLRTTAETVDQPDNLPTGTRSVQLDVLADSADAAPAELHRIVAQPHLAHDLLGDGKAEAIFCRAYREIVGLPSARNAYRRLFEGMADPACRPCLYHCTTGKDRTGWATAALFLLLGVPDDAVMEEYLLTNTELLPSLQPVLDRFEAAGGDPRLLLPVLGVRSEYLLAALDEMHARYGSVEEYFDSGLEVSAETQAALRASLVAPAG